MLKRLGPLPRFVLGMATLLALLAVTAGLWWWLPARPGTVLATGLEDICWLIVSSDGNSLAIRALQRLEVWDLASAQRRASTAIGVTNPYDGAQGFSPRTWFSPDGRTLGIEDDQTGNDEKATLKVWSWTTGDPPWTLPRPDGGDWVDELFLHPDGRQLCFLRDGRTLWAYGSCWDQATGQHLRKFPLDRVVVHGIHQASDGRLLFTNYEYEDRVSSLFVWEILREEEKWIAKVTCPEYHPWRGRLSDDGNYLIGTHDRLPGWEDHLIAFWELPAGRRVSMIRWAHSSPPAPDGRPFCTKLSANHRRLVLDVRDARAGGDTTEIWDVAVSPPVKVQQGAWHTFLLSPNGDWLLVQGRSRAEWAILDTETVCLRGAVEGGNRLDDRPRFGPDSRTLAGGAGPDATWLDRLLGRSPAGPRVIKVWSVPSGKEVAIIPTSMSPRAARIFAYLPDGKQIAVGHEDGRIDIWDIPPRRPWWIEYGLPVVFAVLVLVGVRQVWRAVRKPGTSGAQIAA